MAESKDVPAIAALAVTSTSSSNTLEPAKADHVSLFAHECIRKDLAIVVERGGRIVGAIGLRVQIWPQSGERFLTDVATFGGEGALEDLLHGAREVAARVRLPLYLGAMSKDPAAVMRLYEQHGGRLVGAFYDFTPVSSFS